MARLFRRKGPDQSPIAAFAAESDRLAGLVTFLSHFAPAIGETTEPGRAAASDELDDAGLLVGTRNQAVLESFRAVSRIARSSFQFVEKG